MPKISTFVLDRRYRIIDAPDPLHDDEGYRCKALTDNDQGVVWLDREMPREDREQVIVNAVSQAWQHRLVSIPLVD